MTLTQTQILTTLAYMMGESSVNASTTAPRADFIQRTLEEAYKTYPWRFAEVTATVAVDASGIASLPTNLDTSHPLYAEYFNGDTETPLSEIVPADTDKVVDGDNAYWLTYQSDGTALLNSKDSQLASNNVILRYQSLPPTLNASVGTPYPSVRTLALGARRYVKLGQNPDADISQDESLFQNALSADIAAHQVPAPRKIRRSAQSISGAFTGDF